MIDDKFKIGDTVIVNYSGIYDSHEFKSVVKSVDDGYVYVEDELNPFNYESGLRSDYENMTASFSVWIKQK